MRTLLIGTFLALLATPLAFAEPAKPEWKPLFDGKTLTGWKQAGYGGESQARVENGSVVIPMGDRLSGITYEGKVPNANYEVELEARRVSGSDFFVGLTFPINDSHASLIVGGWGGAVCGISNLDNEDANSNATRKVVRFKKEQWYKVRLRVEPDRIQAWMDDQPIIDVDITGKKIGIRSEIELSKPFGLATFATTSEIKQIKLRELPVEKKN